MTQEVKYCHRNLQRKNFSIEYLLSVLIFGCCEPLCLPVFEFRCVFFLSFFSLSPT